MIRISMFFLLTCVTLSVMFSGCIKARCVTTTQTIQSIGGCDRNGLCGVTFVSGKTGTKLYPTIGYTGTFTKCTHE